MIDLVFPPGLVMIVTALLIALIRKGIARDALVLLAPLITLAMVWYLPDGSDLDWHFLEYQLDPVHSTAVGRAFATIFCIMAFAGGLFALRQARTAELSAAFAYAGSAISVTFAGDLITLFIFWEMMSIGSTLVLWVRNNERSYLASMRYLSVHLLGGILLMAGIGAHIASTGSVEFTAMKPDSVGNWMILAGFLINAGAPPLSAWVADAYPKASPSGTVFLSAFTTKTAVYALWVGFPGVDILIYIGLYMIIYGIIYALLENDIRKLLAYTLVNQVGFMITAIGIGTELALNGAVAHAFAHVSHALLLMTAGSILFMTGKTKSTNLGGLFQSMPVTTINALIGAVTISALPLTAGFVTKSLETSAAAEQGLFLVWMIMMMASAGVVLHAGLKYPWFVFFHRDSGLRPPDPPANMRYAMWFMSLLCIGLGVFPNLVYGLLPYPVDYQPYTFSHIISQLQMLLFAGFVFFALLPFIKPRRDITLDVDWLYRGLFKHPARWFVSLVSTSHKAAESRALARVELWMERIYRTYGPDSMLARTWSSGLMVLWVAIMLVSLLLFGYWE